MKNIITEFNGNIFAEFILSNEEMICVRGGDIDEGEKPPVPPIKL
jgi:hypothetical protein